MRPYSILIVIGERFLKRVAGIAKNGVYKEVGS